MLCSPQELEARIAMSEGQDQSRYGIFQKCFPWATNVDAEQFTDNSIPLDAYRNRLTSIADVLDQVSWSPKPDENAEAQRVLFGAFAPRFGLDVDAKLVRRIENSSRQYLTVRMRGIAPETYDDWSLPLILNGFQPVNQVESAVAERRNSPRFIYTLARELTSQSFGFGQRQVVLASPARTMQIHAHAEHPALLQ